MPEQLNTVEQDSIYKVLQGMSSRIKTLESKFLSLRGNVQAISYELLSNGASDMEFDVNSSVKVTPTGNATYTTGVPAAGSVSTLLILTSGVSSYTITFGTGFKTTGTLVTGVTSARIFALQFISDGTNLYELSRTVAMVA